MSADKTIFPPFLDSSYSKDHEAVSEKTSGPAVFIVKCLLAATDHNKGFVVDNEFCDILTESILDFQKVYKIEEDGNFGPGTRGMFNQVFGLDIDFDNLSPELLTGATRALQPGGEIIVWQ